MSAAAPVRVGTGSHVYETSRPFDDFVDGDVSHVAVDSHDRVFVYRRDAPVLLVFDRSGDLAASWDPPVSWAHGLYINASDEIFLGDGGGHVIMKLDRGGKVLLTLGTRGQASWQAPFNHPTDIAVAPSGDILVSDGYGNSAVHKFSSDGQLLMSWGTPGRGPGEFANPHAIWVDSEYCVYVVDQYNHRVQLFDEQGRFVSEWPSFYVPMDIFIDSDGFIYVTDFIPRLTVLTRSGEIVSRSQSPIAAHGIWGDSGGNLYCAGNHDGVLKLTRL